MCLRTKQNTPLIAEEDITVYKVVQFITDKAKSAEIGKPFSYYVGAFRDEYVYEMDTVLESGLHYEEPCYGESEGFVHKGFHSLQSVTDTTKLMNFMRGQKWFSDDAEPLIIACTIPKGSEYYVGDFDKKVSYASNKLILHSV